MKDNYSSDLLSALVKQSNNECFYKGDLERSYELITEGIVRTMEVDRASIWLFDKTDLVLKCLYENGSVSSGLVLKYGDYEPYFVALSRDPIIVADDAMTHFATSCFSESYLKPLSIKSMLDVPIWYLGELIGVVCIESKTLRNWCECEVNFARALSSLFSFSYSIKEGRNLKNFNKMVREELINERRTLKSFEEFVDSSVLVSKTDEKGRITYVNKKFTEVSKWSYEESIGKDHSIVNSGEHSKEFWQGMYKTVLSGKIWNGVVTNRNRDGELYWVDTYIKANFDSNNKLTGFVSIRQDVTDIIKSGKIIEKKNTYLEHAAKILRHDMHSGINTYIPRGVSSLERRLTPEVINELKLEAPIKMIKEGLKHTQKVYKGVYEFTNLVKKDVILSKESINLKESLEDFLTSTAYKSQVTIEDLGIEEVNESLFCTALDNLIRNGLKYNDSDNKKIVIRRVDDYIFVDDNGRGMDQIEFRELSKPYVRKRDQKESGSGLGLNICITILEEHGFFVDCERLESGTRIKIKLKK